MTVGGGWNDNVGGGRKVFWWLRDIEIVESGSQPSLG
jgi:hypothetical protein